MARSVWMFKDNTFWYQKYLTVTIFKLWKHLEECTDWKGWSSIKVQKVKSQRYTGARAPCEGKMTQAKGLALEASGKVFPVGSRNTAGWLVPTLFTAIWYILFPLFQKHHEATSDDLAFCVCLDTGKECQHKYSINSPFYNTICPLS